MFLVERGNGTADALEELVRTARDKVGVMPRPKPNEAIADQKLKLSPESSAAKLRRVPEADPDSRPSMNQMSDAERELLKAALEDEENAYLT